MITGHLNGGIWGWIIYAWVFAHSFVVFPDLVLRDEGIEAHILWQRRLIEWSEINGVVNSFMDTRIYARNLPFLNRSLAFNIRNGVFTIIPFFHSNYEQAMVFISNKLKTNLSG
jgi:hypothetical protein